MTKMEETRGTDVDEATEHALAKLGLRLDQVDVDVVQEGRKGFLGIGAEEAVVRVTARESAPAAADSEDGERRPRRRRRGGRGRGGGGSGGGGSDGGGRDGGGGGGDGGGGDGGGDGARPQTQERPAERAPRAERTADKDAQATESTRVPGAPDDLPTAPVADPEDELDFAGHTLRDLLTLLGLTETEITAREPETAGDGVGLTKQIFDIYGNDEDAADDLGLLIGRRGETLTALQYLLNVMVSSRYSGDHVFAIDIEQYRRRREQTLVEMANRIAGEVRSSGDVITLEPMTPAERRIIHLALENEQGVTTESVGDGNERQVETMPD